MALVSLSDDEYRRFRELIVNRTGLDFPPARRNDFGVWLCRALDQIQDSVRYQSQPLDRNAIPTTLTELYNALHASAPLVWDTVIDALTVCETHFFRNAPQFDALRVDILPQIIKEHRRRGMQELNIWSAGCASGEEAYSLAILLRELLPDRASWKLNILGTDINKRSLVQAEHGIYRDWSFREAFSLQIRDKYFDRVDMRYHLHEDVRRMVRFEECSLIDSCVLQASQPIKMDLILCRNVILYLGDQIRRWVYQRLEKALAPGGWLVVGHADPAPPNFAPFEAVVLHGTTVYRVPTSQPPASKRPRRRISADTVEPVSRLIPVAPVQDRPHYADAETHYRLGRWHANRQHWNEALYHCEHAVALAPTYTEVYYTLALIHQSTGDIDGAIEDLRRAIYLERNWALPRFMLANIYRERKQYERARRELRNVIAITQSLPPDTAVNCGDGITVARLQDAAERQLSLLRNGGDPEPED